MKIKPICLPDWACSTDADISISAGNDAIPSWAERMIEKGMAHDLPSPRLTMKASALTTPREIREWIETLGYVRIIAALLVIASCTRQVAIPIKTGAFVGYSSEVTELKASRDVERRLQAAQRLGGCSGSDVVNSLVTAIQLEKDDVVAMAAAHSLARFPEASASLLRRWRSPDETVRLRVA